MAIVVVQVGQCGNQLGDELFMQLAIAVASARERDAHMETPFFCDDGMARCVLIDSEPKVVHGVRARHESFIRPENVVCGQSGRGNNWGLGFNGVRDEDAPAPSPPPATRRSSSHRGAWQPTQGFRKVYKSQRSADEQLLTRALRAIHRETRRTAECAAGFEAIVLLHSLSGGTGSGLGARLAEKVRSYFIEPAPGRPVDERREAAMMLADGLDGMLVEKRRARYLLDIAVAPQGCGELALQGINAALTLSIMHRHADATLLLRNDDVMAPSGAVSRSTTKSTNILQRCLTFKEANEVLVALLLPVLRYGVLVANQAAAGRRRRANRHGAIAALVHNCAPVGDAALVQAATGGNKILTLLPTPQNTYEGLRRSVLRCVFFPVLGGKDFLPGCSASLPLDTITARAAHAQLTGGPQHTPEGRRSLAPARGRPRCSGEEHPPWDAGFSTGSGSGRDTDEPTGKGDEEPEEGVVYTEVPVEVPRGLLAYYGTLRGSPVAALARQLEGVAVLNQARELNRALLFPLLKSAAMKVRVGAFVETYRRAGVPPESIVKAYQHVAEVLSRAEEL